MLAVTRHRHGAPFPLARLRSEERGSGLVEVLVVLALVSLIGGLTVRSVAGGARATTRTQDRVQTLGALQTAAERVAREVRAAHPIEGGFSGTSLQVRVRRNGVCSRFTYRVEGTELVQYVERPLTPAPAAPGQRTVANACTTPAATNPPPAGTPRSVLVKGLAAGPVFAYQNASGGAPASAAQVAVVTINLDRSAAGTTPMRVSTRVFVRNTGLGA